MKVYNQWARGKVNTLLVSPGSEHPDNSEWNTTTVIKGETVRVPKSFSIRFVKGVAEVDAQIGKYLIDKKMAHKAPQDEVSGVHSTLILAADLEAAEGLA